MAVELDHVIVPVNHAAASREFYVQLLGFTDEGEQPPFSVARVTPSFTMQLARVRESGIEYGDSFHVVGNMQGPGNEAGARGPADALYFFDPNKHLIEIRHYKASSSVGG